MMVDMVARARAEMEADDQDEEDGFWPSDL